MHGPALGYRVSPHFAGQVKLLVGNSPRPRQHDLLNSRSNTIHSKTLRKFALPGQAALPPCTLRVTLASCLLLRAPFLFPPAPTRQTLVLRLQDQVLGLA